ncbi:MAG: glycosyltransferase family 4 protein [Bacteroidales bacterium]|nr:glycosyltransferase family 4 protein [Bacteroidales bacterium]
MKNKICHLTSVHPTFDTRIFWKECVSLQRAGFDVSLVVAGATDQVADGVKIYGVKKFPDRFSRILKSGKPILQKALEIDADIYHFHDPELLSVGKKLSAKGKKVIYDSHEDLPRQILTKPWIPKFMRGLVSKLVEFVENSRVRKMSAVVAATPHIQERFQKVTKAQVISVCNYPIISEITYNNNWEKKEKAVCYVGGLFLERGIFEMVRAAGAANVRLKLAGSFSPAALKTQVESEPAWKNTDFYGFIGREEINRLLGESMAGLLLLHPMPSYKDSLPIKLFEYMAAGIPVICSDFPLWKSIVYESGCGVCVNPQDLEKISEEIISITENPEKAREMGENGHKAVLEKYNWGTQEKILLELYNSLLNN